MVVLPEPLLCLYGDLERGVVTRLESLLDLVEDVLLVPSKVADPTDKYCMQ